MQRSRRRALARLSTLALVLGAVASATLVFVPVDRGTLQRFVDGFGPFAVPVFVVVAAVLALVFVPGPLLSAASGVLFGVGLGFGASVASAALTAVLGLFVGGRTGASSLEELSGERALALAGLARRQGLGVVVLQRLVPGLPDAPFSYLFGLLRLRVWQVALGTVVGSAPRAFAYTALGDSAVSHDGGLAAWAVGVLVAASVVGAVAGVVVVRRERAATRRPGDRLAARRVEAMTSALVLAGGGVAGIAWELGVLRGVLDARPDLEGFLLGTDVLIGTSAGSTVAALISGGTPLDDLYDAQLAATSAEIAVDVDLPELLERFAAATAGVTDPAERRRRIGALALATDSVSEAERRAAVAARLPVQEWSERDVRIPAVDAETGDVVVFTSDSGVPLVDAVTASCAVPGVWPPTTIDGRRYVDGGVRSGSNADLAAGCDRVLVVTPTVRDQAAPWGELRDEIAALAPARVVTVYADDASIAAFGTNPLAAGTRAPSARAGRTVGAAYADEIAALFG